MKKNWIKWAVGIGSITTFTGVTAILQDNQNDEMQATSDEFKVENQQTNVANLKEAEKTDRENYIAGLDWEDGSWSVDYSDEQATYITPVNPNQGQAQRDVRTERS